VFKNNEARATINLGLNKAGNLFYSDYPKLLESFSKEVMKKAFIVAKNKQADILFDINTSMGMMNFKLDDNIAFMSLNIDNMIPIPAKTEPVDLKANLIESNGNITTYSLSEGQKDDKPITIDLNTDYEFNANALINFILNKVTGNKSNVNFKNGIPVQGINYNGNTVFVLENIEKVNKTISIQHTFNIE
jgi:hypothetical protein